MRYTPIERPPDYCPACLKDIDPSEVLPQAKRNPWRNQYYSRSPTALEEHSVTTALYLVHNSSHLLFSFIPAHSCSSSYARCAGLSSTLFPEIVGQIYNDRFGCAANNNPLERSVVRRLISWCRSHAGTKAKSPARRVVSNSPRSPQRTNEVPLRTYTIVCCSPWWCIPVLAPGSTRKRPAHIGASIPAAAETAATLSDQGFVRSPN